MTKVKIPATVRRCRNNPHNREYGVVGHLSLFFYDEHKVLVVYDNYGHSECCYQYMLENTEPLKEGTEDYGKGLAMLAAYTEDPECCFEFEYRKKLSRDYAFSKWQECGKNLA